MELKTKYSILNSQIDINSTITPHVGLILSRILNIHAIKYASVVSIQAHDEPNSNIIRTLRFKKTSFSKFITPKNMKRLNIDISHVKNIDISHVNQI